MVRSDPQLLERILRNLLSNALRYTERGSIVLGCRRRGSHLRVQVCDTGVGIAEEQMTAIFEEFYQVHNQSRDFRKGLGLGLAIVRRMAELLGHAITVRSVVGKGSVFEVTLPLGQPRSVSATAAADDRVAAPAADDPVAPAAADPVAAAGLVLVIDDDLLVLESLRLSLEAFGYEVVAADTLTAALAGLQQRGRPPDLILADYRLANDRTGSEAIERLRAVSGRSIPGILLTGDTSPQRLKEAQRSGHHLLHKPITMEALQSAVTDALREPGRP